MDALVGKIGEAGVVGCGGAGFPTDRKLTCKADTLIINCVECEPLLRTDRYLAINRAAEIVSGAKAAMRAVGAKMGYIAVKESYRAEADSLRAALESGGGGLELFLTGNYYPAGDEQMLVLDVTGRAVPPGGIPLEVGAVVSNAATMLAVHEAEQGKPLTHKYLTVAGAVRNPVIVYAPVGTSFAECIEAAGGPVPSKYAVIAGGPMMGGFFGAEEGLCQVVTKTTSGILVLPADTPLANPTRPTSSVLRQAKSACIQCSFCTELCPRHLAGHDLRPHKIMRKLAYFGDIDSVLDDPDIRAAALCSECGLCEMYACPMGLLPRQINRLVKERLAKAEIRYARPDCPPEPLPERDFRKVPSKRVAARLDLLSYYDREITAFTELHPQSLRIPLKQHIGAASVPVVGDGEKVRGGQRIASKPENALGAHIHTGIDGVVRLGDGEIIVEAR